MRLNTSATAIAELVNSMKPGQQLVVSARDFLDAFGARSFAPAGSLYDLDRAIGVFLSGCIGSAYGTVRARVRMDPTLGVLISRHDEDGGADHSNFVYHVDADRQWMFDRVHDGWRRKAAA